MHKDYRRGVSWYKKAAQLNDFYAQYNLGLCYLDGDGVKRNERIAIKWFKKAATQGYDKASDRLLDLGISEYWS